jgi:hypothetical protein
MTVKLSRYGFVDRTNPEASARCDRGGEIRKHHQLRREMIWAGARLVWNGMLCCDKHIDVPNPQDRLLVLRADPVPVENPRPDLPMTPLEYFVSDGTPGGGYTEGYVTDQHGAPLFAIPPDPNEIDDNFGVAQVDGAGNKIAVGPLAPVTPSRFPFA